jgi:hypothetical protein
VKKNFAETFNSIHEAFVASKGSGGLPQPNHRPHRKRKSLRKIIAFYLGNLIVMPAILLIYMTVSSAGLADMVEVLGTKIYQMPIPGASFLEAMDGWNKVSIAMVMAIVLAIVLTIVWKKVFEALQDPGRIQNLKKENPFLLYLVTAIYTLTILVDSTVFYIGLNSTFAASWNDQAQYIPLLATVMFSSILALMGAAHANHFRTEKV